MRKKIIVVIALVAFTLLGVSSLVNRDNKIELQKVELQSKQAEIKQLQLDYQVLDKKQSETDINNKAEIEKLRKEKEDLLKHTEELQKQVSAKKEAQRLAQAKINYTASVGLVATASAQGGSCLDWIVGAGISDTVSALALIRVESNCNPYAVNKSSGACGVAQELPCGKSGCALGDGACQVRWMNSYVTSRYGSWANAYSTWLSRSPHWY